MSFLRFLIVTLFDTTGTMIGVAKQAGLMRGNTLPRARHALLADSVATSVGAMFGTSPTSAYIESSSGVAVGGRTGLNNANGCYFIYGRGIFRTIRQYIIWRICNYRARS